MAKEASLYVSQSSLASSGSANNRLVTLTAICCRKAGSTVLDVILWRQGRFLGVAGGPQSCPAPLMKLVARHQGYIIAVFTAWHRVAGVKLHHSLNNTLCHPEFLAPQMQMWPPHWPPQTAAARNAPAWRGFLRVPKF